MTGMRMQGARMVSIAPQDISEAHPDFTSSEASKAMMEE